MASLTRYHVPSLVLVGIGLLVIASGFVTYPHAGQAAYQHHVESVDESVVPTDERVYDFEALSENARVAVARAVDSPDGSASVYGTDSRPPEFEYGDAVPRYFLRYEGDLYRLETYESSLGWLPLLLLAAYVAVGAVAVLVAGLSFRVARPRLAPALAVAYAILVAVFAFESFPRWDDTQLTVGAVLLLAAIPAAGTWHLLDGVVYADG